MRFSSFIWLNAVLATAEGSASAVAGRSIDTVIDLDSAWQLKDSSRLQRRSGQATRISLHAFARQGLDASVHRAVPFTGANTRVASTSNTLPLTPRAGWSSTRRMLDSVLHPPYQPNVTQNAAKIRVALDGQVYLAPIKVGTETFNVVIDTGSADTWLVTSNFTCMTVSSRAEVPQKDCQFGPSYSIGPTYKRIVDRHFNISYADGEVLNGVMAKEKVTFANVTVENQTVAVVNYAAWNGDGISSGLMGFGFPNITRQYPGENPSEDRRGGNVAYDPVFTSMWMKNLTAPVFSIALPRLDFKTKEPINTGALAVGGLPPAPIKFKPEFASAPIEYLSIAPVKDDGFSDKVAQYQLYTIIMEGLVYAPAGTNETKSVADRLISNKPTQNWNTTSNTNKTNSTTRKARRTAPIQATIDSGTTLVYLPRDVAKTINLLWDPPAWMDKGSQTWMVACNATGPRVGPQIDGKILWMDAEDQVLIVKGGDENQCFSAIQQAGDGVTILGDAWMRSVVSVFDVGAGMMRFSPRLD